MIQIVPSIMQKTLNQTANGEDIVRGAYGGVVFLSLYITNNTMKRMFNQINMYMTYM